MIRPERETQMWIDTLSPLAARDTFGPDWRAIVAVTAEVAAGRPAPRPDDMAPEVYEGALYFYGPNGPAVYLFLKSWRDLYRPENVIVCPDRHVIRVPSRSKVASPGSRWHDSLAAADAPRRAGDARANVHANVRATAAALARQGGPFIASVVAPAAVGELAQPENDLHFFLDLMPWIRCGQLPCGWDDLSGRPIVEWLEPDALAVHLESHVRSEPGGNLWPTAAHGLRVRDDEVLQQAARASGAIILVADGSPATPQYVGQAGHRPRPPYVPGTPRSRPPHVGLIAVPEDRPLPPGFTVDPDDRIVRDPAGNCFYEPIPLVGVYRPSDGDDLYSTSLRHDLNRRFGADLIQSGPYDRDASLDGIRRPRPPVTAYMPDRPPVRLETAEEMRGVYEEFKVPFADIYPADAPVEIPVEAAP